MYGQKLCVSVSEGPIVKGQNSDSDISKRKSDVRQYQRDTITKEQELVNFTLTLTPVGEGGDDSEDYTSVLPPSSNSTSKVLPSEPGSGSISKQPRDLKVSVASFSRLVISCVTLV